MKRIFVIDWVLVFAFVVSAVSGFGMHVAGHGNSHSLWHNWAVFHVCGSALFFVIASLHIVAHWRWYKGIIKNGIGRKNKVTAVLSIVFLVLSLTGVALLGVSGPNSPLGLWHYKIGIVMVVISIGHIVRRRSAFRKSLSVKKE